jgi:DNA-directed RNA polymerase specialized sigma24 family protein
MATAQTETILGHICGLIEAEKTRNMTDAELLRRFAAKHDEAAFGGLMRRYGELVWGVCRNLLRSHADAEDAFQATFLVLARQAGSIKKPGAVGSWLYGVGYRVAMKAKSVKGRSVSLVNPIDLGQATRDAREGPAPPLPRRSAGPNARACGNRSRQKSRR